MKWGPAARHPLKTPIRFTSSTVRQSSGRQSTSGWTFAIPELFTRTSRRPNVRSEEHTSELQSQSNLVCRLLLEKKKKKCQLTLLSVKLIETRHIINVCVVLLYIHVSPHQS